MRFLAVKEWNEMYFVVYHSGKAITLIVLLFFFGVEETAGKL